MKKKMAEEASLFSKPVNRRASGELRTYEVMFFKSNIREKWEGSVEGKLQKQIGSIHSTTVECWKQESEEVKQLVREKARENAEEVKRERQRKKETNDEATPENYQKYVTEL